MTDTERTTVTLSISYMNLIRELVGVFGATKAQVISNIVEYFFNNSKNFALLEQLRTRKRKQYPPEEIEIEKRIRSLLKGADKIPFEDFIKDLNLDRQYIVDHFHEWTKKYNIKRINNKIIKQNNG